MRDDKIGKETETSLHIPFLAFFMTQLQHFGGSNSHITYDQNCDTKKLRT
jgi:hypothetical protein